MVELQAEAVDEGSVVEQRVAGLVPMKLVATPRPEKNDWKSIVGPWMVALRATGPFDLGDLEAAALCRLGDRLDLQDVRVERRRPAVANAWPT